MPADCAEHHRTDKCRGDEPARAATEECGPKPDCDHGQQMIPTGERVAEASTKTPRQIMAVMAGVGVGKNGQS